MKDMERALAYVIKMLAKDSKYLVGNSDLSQIERAKLSAEGAYQFALTLKPESAEELFAIRKEYLPCFEEAKTK